MDHSDTEYHRGEMDIHAQAGTYKAFGVLMSWGCVVQAALLAFLVLKFCTTTPFLFSAAAAIVILVLGGLFLSRKPAAH